MQLEAGVNPARPRHCQRSCRRRRSLERRSTVRSAPRTTHWRFGAGKGEPIRLEPGDRSVHLPHAIPRGRGAGSNAGPLRAFSRTLAPPPSAPSLLSPSKDGFCVFWAALRDDRLDCSRARVALSRRGVRARCAHVDATRDAPIRAAPTTADRRHGRRRLRRSSRPSRRSASSRSIPSATETLIAIGATSEIVGRTRYDTAPEVAALPSVGGGVDPSVEAIVNLQPDLVIAWQSDKRQATRERARRARHSGVRSPHARTRPTSSAASRRSDASPDAIRRRPPSRRRCARRSTPFVASVARTSGADGALRRLHRSADDRGPADVHRPAHLARRRQVDLHRREPNLAERRDGRDRAPRSRHAHRAGRRIQDQFARSFSRSSAGWRDLRAVRDGHVVDRAGRPDESPESEHRARRRACCARAPSGGRRPIRASVGSPVTRSRSVAARRCGSSVLAAHRAACRCSPPCDSAPCR